VNILRRLLGTLFLVVVAMALPAGAAGTARIQQSDGSVKAYTNVRIVVENGSMALTSSDGKGTIYIGHAACTKTGELIRCLPYEATLDQHGQATRIALKSGTVWLNPTESPQPLSHSSTQLPPHGVMLSMQTKSGTFVSLTGTADVMKK
jgi:hypothetical protein